MTQISFDLGRPGRDGSSEVAQLDALVAEVRRHRAHTARRRAVLAICVPCAVASVWLVAIAGLDWWVRVGDQWVASATMSIGSFVAGATPQGGGAVAFPVFTKVLGVDSEAARTFALCIQAVGMGAAAIVVLVTRRSIDRWAAGLAVPCGMAGFSLGLWLSARVSAAGISLDAYSKVIFTVVVVTMALTMWRTRRATVVESAAAVVDRTPAMAVLLGSAAAVGGVLASLVGSGVDVALYLVLVAVAGTAPGVAIRTSVVVMAAVSTFGFVVVGLVDGQLFAVSAGRSVADLWLASVPVVVVGAPLGAWVVGKLTDRSILTIVLALAFAELVSTLVLVDELRSDPWLGVSAAVAAGSLLLFCWLGLPALRLRLRPDCAAPSRAFLRGELAFAPVGSPPQVTEGVRP